MPSGILRAREGTMKKSLEAVELFKEKGISFVPMPVTSKEDELALVEEAQQRLSILISLAKVG